MATISVPGFKQYSTTSNPRSLDPTDITLALNMVWEGNRVRARDGSYLHKNSSQWSGAYVVKGTDFKVLTDNFFREVVILNNGKIFAIRSDDANFDTPAATWTEILSPSATSPALSSTALVDLYGFNNKLFVCNNTNNYWYINFATNQLVLNTDPTNLGTGNIASFGDKAARLVALDDNGRTHLSVVNDGTDMTGSGSGSLNYGRTEGLKATSIAPYGDDLLIATEDSLTLKYQTYYLTGIQFYDSAIVGSDTDQFQVKKLNSVAGLVGRTTKEILGDTIGLTPRGFVPISKTFSDNSLTERDYISFSIKEIIKNINFKANSAMFATVDYVNGLYLCAVPYGKEATISNMILVYDFLRSSPAEKIYRWSIWTFPWNITALYNVQGVPHVADSNGNIYAINDERSNFADNGQAVSYSVRTAAIGGSELAVEKDFGNLTVLFTDINTDFTIDINSVIDGITYNTDPEGDLLTPLAVELAGGSLLYDEVGVFYDDFNLYDSSGSDQRVVTLTSRGGRATSMQWVFSTNTTGVSWGLGGFWLNLEGAEGTNESGVNNNASI